MCVLIFAGPFMFYGDDSYNLVRAPLVCAEDDPKCEIPCPADTDPDEVAACHAPPGPTNRMKNNTLVFNTFMLMNYFNMINSRVIGEKELNICKNSLKHLLFWAVFAIMNGV